MRAPTLGQRLALAAAERLPQGPLSRAWGWIARRERPRTAVRLLMHGFAHGVGIDLTEAAAPMAAYPSLEALFLRQLRAGARPVAAAATALLCPVDGRVGAHGTVTAGTLLQVKGRTYALADLLDDAAGAARFEGGAYATLYLAPMDYHRVHVPTGGVVGAGRLIPGALWPVFGAACDRVPNLFARNERLVTYLDTPTFGRLAAVMVGATLVGRMTVTYDPDVVTNRRGSRPRALAYTPPRPLERGAELGAFALGSTVILLAEPGRATLDLPAIGAQVRVGSRIGTLHAGPRTPARGERPRRTGGPEGSGPSPRRRQPGRARAGAPRQPATGGSGNTSGGAAGPGRPPRKRR